jgi:DNA-binding MarR family transcriptional regulator
LTKSNTDLLQGTLDVLILKNARSGRHARLGDRPAHPAGLAGRVAGEPGLSLPGLHRLEEEGWIAAEWGASENNRKAKFYRLTRAGQRQLEAETENWKRLAEAVGRILQTA